MSYFLDISNNSHYVNSNSKTRFRLIRPNNFMAQKSKQMSYYVRLYFHWQHVRALGGLCYFYTLTYNDKSLPYFHGIPCFNHANLREFLRSSGFDKVLYRDYGFRLQYFVSCELGEGKGKRGFDNNPHYHVIFFLIPDGKQKKPFNSAVFRDLVRKYWCGPSHTPDGRRISPYDYKYGIAMPGKNYGLVESAAALRYVSKYVLKDTVYRKLRQSLINAAKKHIYNRLCDMSKAMHLYYRYAFDFKYLSYTNPKVIEFIDRLFNRLYKKDIFRLYLPKVFVSQGVGLYALKQVNTDGYTITIPVDRKKVIDVPIPLYLYRKMYYDIVKDAVGNNKYVLNSDGLALRVSRLDDEIGKKVNEIYSLLPVYSNDYKLGYDPKDPFGLMSILYDYVEYDKIYRNRLCPISELDVPLDIYEDYARFLVSEYYSTNYKDEIDKAFIIKGNCTYESHVYFKDKLKYFNKIDDMLEYHYICQNDAAELQYIENQRIKRMLSKDKVIQYVRTL